MTSPAGPARHGRSAPPQARRAAGPPAPRAPQPGRHRPSGAPPAPRRPPEAAEPPTEEIPTAAPIPVPVPAQVRRHAGGSRRARKPRRVGRAVLVGGLSLLAVGAVAAVVVRPEDNHAAAPPAASADPATAAVGSCVLGRSDDDLEVVDCSRPGATDRVVAKVTGTRAAFDADADLTFCGAAPETESAYYAGPDTGAGPILCLVPLTRGS